MSANYAAQQDALKAQQDALNSLYSAYECARDFTMPVLRTAFGDPPPPPSECFWPPPGITETEADSRLRWVRYFLQQSKSVLLGVLRDIEAAQVRLVASGFDVPRSLIIAKPLETFRGGMLNACCVTDIVKSAAAEDAALEKVLGEISVELVLLEGKIADSTPPTAEPSQSETAAAVTAADGIADDDSAWVPAVTLWKDQFTSMKAVTKFRKDHPDMFRNPSQYKLQIHAGRWAAHFAKRAKGGFEALGDDAPSIADDPAVQEDALTAAAERVVALRAKKQAGKQK